MALLALRSTVGSRASTSTSCYHLLFICRWGCRNLSARPRLGDGHAPGASRNLSIRITWFDRKKIGRKASWYCMTRQFASAGISWQITELSASSPGQSPMQRSNKMASLVWFLIFTRMTDIEKRFACNRSDGSLIERQLPRGAGPGSPRRICFACGRIRPVCGPG